jgi:hypothetical protein
MATVLCPDPEAESSVSELGVARSGDTITVSWRVGGALRRTVIDRSRPGALSRERPVTES